MADYKAGNLTLELFGIDRSADKTITNVVNKLNLLQRSLNVFQKVNATAVGKNLSASFYNIGKALGAINENDITKLSQLSKATNYIQRFLTVVQKSDSRQVYGKLNSLFRSISSSVNSIDQSTLSNITAVSTAISSLGRFSTKITKLDFSKTETGFKNLAVAIQPFLNKVKEAEASLIALDRILRRTSSKKTQGLIGENTSSKKNSGGIWGFAKIGITIHAIKRLGGFMADLVQAGSDYNETLNLWQVAMRDNLDTADQFINKMQKAYGISSKTLMNAQAIFRNMIGSLGQISDATAYALSEALVQMSVDFSSLYNVQLESAFQKMQSMLAGQVRPIRSAGLDMTETTLFMYYQQLGGTKTMRQLNRTEKQLLSILAVYQQMGSAGALGDMSKTLNQFANQSRMLTEYWQELKTWSGLLLKDLIDQSGLLIKINAFLITTTEIVKAIAQAKGIGDENFLTGMFETAELTNDEIDKLQGKLLDFDKFRSLEGAAASPLAIDEKLLQAISGYSSKIDQAENAAQKLAGAWLEVLGFTKSANGDWEISQDELDELSNTFEAISISVGIILGHKLYDWLIKVASGANIAAIAMNLLNYALLGGAVYAILQAIDAFNRGDVAAGLLASTIATVLVGAFVLLHKEAVVSAIQGIAKFISQCLLANTVNYGFAAGIAATVGGLLAFAAAVGLAFYVFQNWDTMNGVQKVISVIGVLTVALLGAAIAFGAFHSAWSLGLAIVGIAAGITAVVAAVNTAKGDIEKLEIPNFANGASDIDSGTIFRAGEFGKTEAVYTGSNGKTNVANVRQMEQAFYNALSRHSREGNGTIVVQAYLDGDKVYENTTARARARGNIWAKA